MAEQASPAGSIYDLDYRPYEGERLGRPYAVVSLYLYSLRAIFGIGRSAWAKVFAFGLAAFALLPAGIQLAIAAITPIDFELIKPAGHFAYVQVIVALFCAVVTPEIVGRDQRSHTLPLYFSRAISRADYVTAKLGALATALLAITGLPLILLVLGSAVAADDVLDYLRSNADLFPPILASSILESLFMAGVSLAIASHSSRRGFATGAVFLFFVLLTTFGNILVETTTGDARAYSILISPFDVLGGSVYWLFDTLPPRDSLLTESGIESGYYLPAALVYIAVALAILYRRFMRMSV